MTLTEAVAKRVITRLIKGQDYRIEIVTLINAEFLQYVMDFFKKVVEAKLRSQSITPDWYKKEFLNTNLPLRDIAINSGLNEKTIHNMYNSSTKEIVIDASYEHYDTLYESIKELIKTGNGVDITLTIKLKGVSVDLNIGESLIVINTLAVKRAAIRGGSWSTVGKRVEKPLMITLCKLFGVEESFYKTKIKNQVIDNDIDFEREIDFYLCNPDKKEDYKCEVKLMGRGNPESADAVIARDSKVFIADKLSETNKRQLNSRRVEWVQLRDDEGFKRFDLVLSNLRIPHIKTSGDIDNNLENIFKDIFN